LHLGNTSKVPVYILQTLTLAAETGGVERQIFNSTHPTLQGTILGEVYNSEDKDLVEQGLTQYLMQCGRTFSDGARNQSINILHIY
jgi:hypothetical protein